jgi:hypothetical protein
VRSPAEIAAAGRDAAHKLRDTRDIENASTAVLMAIDDLRAALADFDRIAAERRQLARAVAAAAYPAHTSVAGQVAQQLADLATFSAMKRPHFRNQILRAAASVIQNADGLMDMQDRSAADEIERVKDHLAHRLQQLLPAEELA